MSTTYELEITEDLKHHFESLLETERVKSEKEVILHTRQLLKQIKENDDGSYVTDHVELLESMISMLTDNRWNMEADDKHHVLQAMSYLIRKDDVIPDNIPGLGFLDDCIIIEVVAEKLEPEIDAYHEYKKAEAVYGKDKEFLVSDWLEVKRMELFSRMRSRRNRRNRDLKRRSTRVRF